MGYSKDIINSHLNTYLNDIITETKGVIHTINKKFNMNQTEFEKKFSEDVKQNIINNINKNFDLITKEGNEEIDKLKNKILIAKNKLNCDLDDPFIFQGQFIGTKQAINILIESTSYDIEILYTNFQNVISKLINDYIEDEDESEKMKKYLAKTFKIQNYFRNIIFEPMGYIRHFFINFFGFFFGFRHDYKEDIRNTCNEYEKMLKSSILSIENDFKDKFEELKTKGIKLIKVIFNTATSNFEDLQKNYEVYTQIKQLIQSILKDNNL